jgi:hypothetical protein
MADLDVTPTADDMLKVCLTEEGITSCCFVSSQHLVQDHQKQLHRANARKAAAAFQREVSGLEWEAMMKPLHDA